MSRKYDTKDADEAIELANKLEAIFAGYGGGVVLLALGICIGGQVRAGSIPSLLRALHVIRQTAELRASLQEPDHAGD